VLVSSAEAALRAGAFEDALALLDREGLADSAGASEFRWPIGGNVLQPAIDSRLGSTVAVSTAGRHVDIFGSSSLPLAAPLHPARRPAPVAAAVELWLDR